MANHPRDERLNELLAAELRAMQARANWSRAKLQRETGIPKNTLERVMLGRADIGVTHLLLICGVLGVRASDVLGRAEAQLDPETPAELMKRHLAGPPN